MARREGKIARSISMIPSAYVRASREDPRGAPSMLLDHMAGKTLRDRRDQRRRAPYRGRNRGARIGSIPTLAALIRARERAFDN